MLIMPALIGVQDKVLAVAYLAQSLTEHPYYHHQVGVGGVRVADDLAVEHIQHR